MELILDKNKKREHLYLEVFHYYRELIMEKMQEEEEQKETRKPERKGRHPKYGEGEIISEDEMMIELEFPGYGKKQFLKAFGEVEVLKGL